jgi:hypothetical protein
MDSQYDEISLCESEGESVWESDNGSDNGSDNESDDEGEEGCFLGLAPLNLDEEFASVSSVSKEPEVLCTPCGNECAICMDDIGTKNCTVTECGHRFHSSCIFRNMMERIECPMCRKDLVDMPEEEEEEDDEEYEESVDEEGEDEEEAPRERDVTCKQMADKLLSLGYTPADILYFAIGRCHSSEAARLNDELDDRMTDLVDRMLDGELAVDHRDGRTYAQVLANQPPPPQAPLAPLAPQSHALPHAHAEPKSPRRMRPEIFEQMPTPMHSQEAI